MTTGQTSPHPFTALEKATFLHLAVLLLGASWLYGGNIWWMRTALSVWASLGIIITIAVLFEGGGRGRAMRRRLWWLLPWLLFIILVAASAFNPSARSMTIEGETVLVHFGAARAGWPSSVLPDRTLQELWFYAAIYLAAFNILLVPRGRRWLRLLVALGAGNCLVIAGFGTVQKLLAADIYFGAGHSPNPRFFATFLYYNHWGAFMILWLAAAAGLLFHYASRQQGRDLWHSPFTGAVLGLLVLAASAPVSASRAATGMMLGVTGTAAVHGLIRIIRHRSRERRSLAPPVLALLVFVIATGAAIGWLAQRSIDERVVETRANWAKDQSVLGARAGLYHDTWQLIQQKPAFGWGLESYANVIGIARPRGVGLYDKHENTFAEAHCDWLQSLLETGFVGTGLAILMGLVPLLAGIRQAFQSPLVPYVLLGAGLILLYALVEFPFANGAVVISFWLLLFAACRYARLERASEP
ncbi:MAG: O-antigen ligase family protein [Opitutaceae bacterium]|nr:O-antigen ligase family protein [Opitutaceae bacterium]